MLKRVLLGAVALIAAPQMAQAVVLFSDTFNGNPYGPNKVPSGWAVTAGSVNVVQVYGGHAQIDMRGASGDGRIQTLAGFNLVSGNTYRISFDYGAVSGQPQALQASIGGYTSGVFNIGSPLAALVHASFQFSVGASVSGVALAFTDVSFSPFADGLLLDNVVLEQVTSIPVPPSALLFATGLMGIGFLGRGRKSI